MLREIFALGARTEHLSSCPTDVGTLKEDLANIMKLIETTADAERRARSGALWTVRRCRRSER
jgi:hypothetical protein